MLIFVAHFTTGAIIELVLLLTSCLSRRAAPKSEELATQAWV